MLLKQHQYYVCYIHSAHEQKLNQIKSNGSKNDQPTLLWSEYSMGKNSKRSLMQGWRGSGWYISLFTFTLYSIYSYRSLLPSLHGLLFFPLPFSFSSPPPSAIYGF